MRCRFRIVSECAAFLFEPVENSGELIVSPYAYQAVFSSCRSSSVGRELFAAPSLRSSCRQASSIATLLKPSSRIEPVSSAAKVARLILARWAN